MRPFSSPFIVSRWIELQFNPRPFSFITTDGVRWTVQILGRNHYGPGEWEEWVWRIVRVGRAEDKPKAKAKGQGK